MSITAVCLSAAWQGAERSPVSALQRGTIRASYGCGKGMAETPDGLACLSARPQVIHTVMNPFFVLLLLLRRVAGVQDRLKFGREKICCEAVAQHHARLLWCL